MKLKERQKVEALRRIKLLRFHPNVAKDFESGILNASESRGILFWLTGTEKEAVKKFEEKWDATVYHLIRNETEFGQLLTMLYVSKYEEEWDEDCKNLLRKDSYPMDSAHSIYMDGYYTLAYVENVDDPDLSEIGGVVIAPYCGGVMRLY